MAEDFNAEQKRYLEGFASGVAAARLTGGLALGQAARPPSRRDPMRSTSRRRTPR